MTKGEYVKKVATLSGASERSIRAIMDAMRQVVVEEIQNEGFVNIVDGIKVYGQMVPEREHRNPQTGGVVVKEAHLAPKCRIAKSFKEAI